LDILETKEVNSYIVKRRAIVYLTSDVVKCSSPIVALSTIDELCNYEEILRQTTRDGNITQIDFDELDGASIELVDGNENDVFEFEEEDLDEIKASLGINNARNK
jgi:hypothetical protein